MKRRPLSVTVIAWIYILVSVGGIAAHITDFKPQHLLDQDALWPLVVRLLGTLAGVFMLRGNDWARWLAVAWIAFHVVLSAFQSRHELVVHSVICGVLTFLLFRPPANEYFRAAKVST